MKKISLFLSFLFVFLFSCIVSAKELPEQDHVSVNKTFIISLDQKIDSTSLTGGITVYDSANNPIEVNTMLVSDSNSDFNKVAIEPKYGAWSRGQSYTIEIKNIKYYNGQTEKEPITMKFSTDIDYTIYSTGYEQDEKFIWNKANTSLYKTYSLYVDTSVNHDFLEACLSVDYSNYLNILKSKEAAEVMMKTQTNLIYNYLAKKYPKQKIRVALFFNEEFNKYPNIVDNSHILYNETTGKYSINKPLCNYENGTFKYYLDNSTK